MPNRNEKGSPKLIYRIDSRPPDVIFNQGFKPWGNNRNFFEHVLGYSIMYDTLESGRSGIVSASDSPDSCLRFLGVELVTELEEYLYEIRADENVYSAQRTVSFYQQRISTGLVEFEQGDIGTMEEAMEAISTVFAYQREWFNVGVIQPQRVRSAWRVDTVPINPNHIRHQQGVLYTPRINEPEIFNPNYVDDETYANDLPYTEGATIQTASRLSIPDELLESDASGGVGASLGFACSLPHDSFREKRLTLSKNINCYLSKDMVHKHLGTKKLEPVIFSQAFPTKVYFSGSKFGDNFLLSWISGKKGNVAVLVDSSSEEIPDFIFDSFHCFVWNSCDKEYSYALTPVYIGFQTIYEIAYTIATVNDESQKWTLEKTKETKTETFFRVKSLKIKDFSLQRNIKQNKIYLRWIKDESIEFEEIYIVISKTKTDSCILLPQDSKTRLVDIKLSWFYKNINYVPVPETGWSRANKMPQNKFFYDLNTCKILYINDQGKVFALYNTRNDYNRWNWVRWIDSDMKKTSEKRLMWYFQNQKWDTESDINYRNIRSFSNNDYLRVIIAGVNWGGLYTTWLPVDTNSLALFRIDSNANI